MTRVRTHKQNKYFSVSNLTAQDHSMSFGALGLLTYCLSMPESWEFHPQVIWKQRDSGRKSTYDLFGELIEKYHCIRIRLPNPKAKNLPGEIEYEMFDDPEDCKKRIKELEKEHKFLEHGGNFKKCFRRSTDWNAEEWDTNSWNLSKNNHTSSEEEVSNKEISSSKKKGDDDLVFDDNEREQLNNYAPDEISEALDRTHKNCSSSKNSSRVKFFFTTLINLKESKKNKKLDPYTEVTQKYGFKNSEFYNEAECHLTKDAIGFTRGMNQKQLDFKYFSFYKLQELCDQFGIKLKIKEIKSE